VSRDLYLSANGAQMSVPAEIVVFRHSSLTDRGRYVVHIQVPRTVETLYGKVWSPAETFCHAVVDDFGDLVRVPS
jgi:hypothetical protein